MKKLYVFLVFASAQLLISNITIAQAISDAGGNGTAGYAGNNMSFPDQIEFNAPCGIVGFGFDEVYVADTKNNRVRRTTYNGGVISIAGNGIQGYNGDNIAADTAELNAPVALALDQYGNIYIAEQGRIREVNTVTNIITTVAGNGTLGYNGDGIAATTAELNFPSGLTVDNSGNIYIADYGNARIRKVSAATGLISTIAGTGTPGYNGDNINAILAQLTGPADVTLDSSGNIYIADEANNRVRKITAATGTISTIAGTGIQGYNGDNVAANTAELSAPTGVIFDMYGSLYITDHGNNRIRMVDMSTGIISTAVGTGVAGYNTNGYIIPATTAELNGPMKIGISLGEDLFIVDSSDSRIQMASQECIRLHAGSIHVTGENPACDSTNDTLTLYGAHDYEYNYRWMESTDGVNFTLTGSDSTYNTGTLTTTTYFKAAVGCLTDNNAYFTDTTAVDTITIGTIAVTPTASITVSPSADMDEGETVTFTAAITNGGLAPVYQWQKNHVNIPNMIGNHYSTNNISNNDTITCLLYSSAVCANPDTVESNKIVMQVTSEIPQLHTINVSLSPNPNNGTFIIDASVSNGPEATIEITNVVGQVVYNTTSSIVNGQLHKETKLSNDLPSGIYMLHIKTDYATSTTQFVISK